MIGGGFIQRECDLQSKDNGFFCVKLDDSHIKKMIFTIKYIVTVR